MTPTKKNFYKVNTIIIFSLTLLAFLVKYIILHQNSFQNYSTSEICIWFVSPFLLVLFSVLLSKIILSFTVSKEKAVTTNEASFATTFKQNVWKQVFFFILASAILLLFVPIVYFVIYGKEVSLSQNFWSLNGFDFFIIIVLGGCTAGVLYTFFLQKRMRYFILVLLLAIGGFFLTVLVLANTSVSVEEIYETSVVEDGYHEGDAINMTQDTEEISYEQGYESRYQDSINALKYTFYYEDIDHLPCGAYFADLWDDPLQDSDSTQYVLINYLQDYMNLRKYSDVGSFLDSSTYLKLTPQTQKVFDKIERNPVRLLSAFKSYSPMVYYMIPNEIYEASGLRNLTQLLLQTHKELYKNKAVLEEIYYIMSLTYEDQSHYGRSDYYLDLKSYISNEVLTRLQSDENFYKAYGDSNEISSYTKGEAVWLYTFWARRYKEQNDKAVYTILNEIEAHYQ